MYIYIPEGFLLSNMHMYLSIHQHILYKGGICLYMHTNICLLTCMSVCMYVCMYKYEQIHIQGISFIEYVYKDMYVYARIGRN
jgi:hypothetical protein